MNNFYLESDKRDVFGKSNGVAVPAYVFSSSLYNNDCFLPARNQSISVGRVRRFVRIIKMIHSETEIDFLTENNV